jgi:hypothetical protein
MDSKNLGVAMRACVADLASGFVRQIDSKGMKVVAAGAALALVLGVGAGVVGRAPVDRALHPHPMTPVPGTSQIATATPPLTEAPSQPPVAPPIRVAERDGTPAIATGDDPSGDSQVTSTGETPVRAAVDSPALAQVETPTTQPPRPRYDRRNVYRYEAAPDYAPPPWAYRGPPQWAPPPPPPPDYDPD